MIRELGPSETALAYKAMLELRPHIGTEAAFTTHINLIQRPEGYRLIGSFVDRGPAVAVAGFRLTHHLAWGRAVYCDDLSTRVEYQGRGHGRRLLDWIVNEGKRLHCEQFHLDSGVGAARAAAHRLYISTGMRVASLHFLMTLRDHRSLPVANPARE